MQKVWVQRWDEKSGDDPARDDGYSLHLSWGSATQYVEEVAKRQEDYKAERIELSKVTNMPVPWSITAGTPYQTMVSDKKHAEIRRSKVLREYSKVYPKECPHELPGLPISRNIFSGVAARRAIRLLRP